MHCTKNIYGIIYFYYPNRLKNPLKTAFTQNQRIHILTSKGTFILCGNFIRGRKEIMYYLLTILLV